MRFYESLQLQWGRIFFVEKLSYINQTPFQMGDTTVTFVGSDLPFTVAIGSTHTQNLGGAEFHCLFVPEKNNSFYGAIDLQGEFGSSFQSYFASLSAGRNF